MTKPCFVSGLAQSEIEETLERIKSHEGVKGYVIMNNEGEVLRKLPGMSNEKAREYGEEIYSLARKARHVVRDINPTVRLAARECRRCSA